MKKKDKEFVAGVLLIIAGVLLMASVLVNVKAQAAEPPRSEADYVAAWCNAEAGQVGWPVYDDGGKTAGWADCFLIGADGERYAIEFDFSHKWAESVAQALWYAERLQAQAAIVLIRHHKTSAAAWARHRANLFAVLRRVSGNVPVVCLERDGSETGCLPPAAAK